ncbi:MAG: hypothetical protein ACI9EZ_001018 [Halobacteriales archaeon]|jgi:hypothetical protein
MGYCMSVSTRSSIFRGAFARAWRSLKGFAQGFAFWSAIGLPFIAVPLLLSGLGTTEETMAFLALLIGNVLALIGGRGYAQR